MFAASKHMDIYLSISLFIGFQSLLQTQLRIGWLFLYCLYLLFSYPFFPAAAAGIKEEGDRGRDWARAQIRISLSLFISLLIP